ncbi:hypothetical protein [Salinisphaera orenii]|uniref:hypothetical protein n=1 Tax=Salinisphaera orenii TaxID=856731 RepID=UPI00162313BB|nr:hypothetical protein [Salinisphaera orenii]
MGCLISGFIVKASYLAARDDFDPAMGKHALAGPPESGVRKPKRPSFERQYIYRARWNAALEG